MATASFYPGEQGLPVAGGNELTKLKEEVFTLRGQLEKVQKESDIFKQQLANQKKELEDTKAAKAHLEKATKKNQKVVEDQKDQIETLRGMFVGVNRKHDELKALNEKFEQEREDYQRLKRRVSETSSSAEDENSRKSLQEKVARREKKLKEKNAEIQKLEKEVKSERKRCRVKSDKLSEVQGKLDHISDELKKANEMIADKENEIRECHGLISNQNKDVTEQGEKIRSLEEQLASFQATIDNQNARIYELNEEVNFYSRSIDENRRLQEDKKAADSVISWQDHKIRGLENDEILWEALVNEKQKEIEKLTEEREKNATFVEAVKVSSDFPENVIDPTANQLEKLGAHVEKKLALVKQLCSLMNQTMRISSVIVPPTLPSSNTPPPQAHVMSETQSSAFLPTPPPPSREQSSDDDSSTDNGDQLYDDLMSDIMLSIDVDQLQQHEEPSTSEKAQQRKMGALHSVTKTIVKKKANRMHVEIIAKRTLGRGPGNVGAKYFCSCDFVSNSKTLLETHIQHFSQDRNFICQVCPKRFLFFGHLKHHMKATHFILGALDHMKGGCRSCGTLFASVQERRQHICPKLQNHTTPLADDSNVPMSTPSPPPTPEEAASCSTSAAIADPSPPEVMAVDDNVELIDLTYSPYPIPPPRDDDNDNDDRCVPVQQNLTMTTTAASSSGINGFIMEHEVDYSPDAVENSCVCGIPFPNRAALNKHIQMRNRN